MAHYEKELTEEIKLSDKLEIMKIDKFWLGILVGFVGGIIGNVWTSYWFNWTKNITDSNSIIGAVGSTIVMIAFAYELSKKTKCKTSND